MAQDGTLRILVGTRKGTYIVEGNARRKTWQVGPVAHEGDEIYHVVADPRHPGDIYAAVNNMFFGPSVQRSRNGGKTWKEIATPLFPERKSRKFEMDETNPSTPVTRAINNLWHIEPGHPSEPNTLYLGADPHLLFRSPDLGGSWEPIVSINQHPSKKDWAPGFGGACLHTILVDPRDPRRLYVGLSAVGTFRSEDGGTTWTPTNRGVLAPFQPDKHPETGQCVHHVAADAGDPDTFYRQDHGGMYVSHDRMDRWVRIGKPLGDDFGFGVASPSALPGRAYFVRLDGRARVTGEGHFQVHEWNDKTRQWRKLVSPKAFPGHFGVQREGITTDGLDPPGIYVGTTTGQLFVSPDAGRTWRLVPFQFPAIHSVSISNPTRG
ncbi:glycosyl hydrolase BNR repeat-containing [mine drainage metagenome]|uniref:Glycosyl hydrolase BNR repeat-containing n=1 Tax=mine drainage metagenome TaxID=410659 RepID=T1CSK5_9ZZZZ